MTLNFILILLIIIN